MNLIKAALAGTAASLALLAASFLTPLQLLLLACLGCCLVVVLVLARKKGLVTFLPNWLVSLLFKRSLYDILCDVYFLKRVSRLLAALLGPIIHQARPGDAYQHFQDLDKPVKEAIFTKGLANVIPGLAEKLLPSEDLPRTQFLTQQAIQLGVKSLKWDKTQDFYQAQLQKLRKTALKPEPLQVSEAPALDKIMDLSRPTYAQKLATASSGKLISCALGACLLLALSRKLSPRSFSMMMQWAAGVGGLSLCGLVVALAYCKLRARAKQARLKQHLGGYDG